jgi:hypothetical protein
MSEFAIDRSSAKTVARGASTPTRAGRHSGRGGCVRAILSVSDRLRERMTNAIRFGDCIGPGLAAIARVGQNDPGYDDALALAEEARAEMFAAFAAHDCEGWQRA